jgi:hypothetical protein
MAKKIKVACGFTLCREVKGHFEKQYPYVDITTVSDTMIIEFWEQEHIFNLNNREREYDAFYDHLISQGLVEVYI